MRAKVQCSCGSVRCRLRASQSRSHASTIPSLQLSHLWLVLLAGPLLQYTDIQAELGPGFAGTFFAPSDAVSASCQAAQGWALPTAWAA